MYTRTHTHVHTTGDPIPNTMYMAQIVILKYLLMTPYQIKTITAYVYKVSKSIT